MNNTRKNTAFYIEILALLLMLMFGTTIVVQLFGHARTISMEAEQLAKAVPLVHNAAEVFVSGGVEDDYTQYFDASGTPTTKEASYYMLTMEVEEVAEKVGVMKSASICMLRGTKVVYELQTQKYVSQ